MKKIISLTMVIVFLALVSGCTQYHAQGAGTGAVLGGAAGALLNRHNPWQGGVWGAVLGAIAGATLSDISLRASEEAVQHNKPVQYRTTDGRGVYEAYPLDYNEQTKCHKVQERVWEDGRLVKDQIKEVCEGQKTEKRY